MPVRRQLTPEGQRMFDNMIEYEAKLQAKLDTPPPPEEPKEPPLSLIDTLEYQRVIYQIHLMIKNSEMVVEDCKKLMSGYTTIEQYHASEAKVALTIHTNNIERLTRVLNGKPAFEHDIKL